MLAVTVIGGYNDAINALIERLVASLTAASLIEDDLIAKIIDAAVMMSSTAQNGAINHRNDDVDSQPVASASNP